MSNDNKKTLKQSYNNYASERDKSTIEPWKANERSDFLSHLQGENAASLLEIGAGTGRDSIFFKQQGLDVICGDLSEEMVKLCHDKGLIAQVMDFYDLQFLDQSFDAVYALNCLLHVPKANLASVLKEIHRVMRVGGLLFCGLYGGQNTEGVWEKDTYEPKRFFSMYHDEDIIKVMSDTFQLIDFHTVSMGEETPHFQSMLLQKEGHI